MHGSGSGYEPNLKLLRVIIPFYFIYIGLVNISFQRELYLKILKYSWILLFLNTTIVYLAYGGLIEFADLEVSVSRRLSGYINMNII